MYSKLAFSKPKDSSNICLTSGFNIILLIAEIKVEGFVKNKSVKVSFGPCTILINDSVLFPNYSTLPQAFKATIRYSLMVCSTNLNYHCKSALWPSLRSWSCEISIALTLPCFSITPPFFFYHVFHCNWDSAFNIAIAKFFLACGIILFWVAQEFNNYIT